jgi:Lysozyme like domain
MPAVAGTLSPAGAHNLSEAQIAQVASKAGFTGNDLKIAVAVAMAESGGNANAHNGNAGTGDDSYGLWQINYYGSLKTSRTKSFGPGPGLFDPQKNANAAYQIFKGSGWGAWTTYRNGDYKQHMGSTLDDAVKGALLGAAGGPIASAAGSAIGVGDSINSLGSNLLKTGESIGGIAVALVLVVLGVVLLARKQVLNVLPAGKAIKTLKTVTS